MTNEQLAELIGQGGNEELLPLLWEKMRKLYIQWSGKYYTAYKNRCDLCGVSADDLRQEAYLSMLEAVKAYNSRTEEHKDTAFTSYCLYPFKNHAAELIGVRTTRERNEALNITHSSLDEPLDYGDGDTSATISDIIPDQEAEQPFRDIEQEDYCRTVRELVAAVLNEKPREHDVIKRRYYDNETLSTIAADMGVSGERVRQLEKVALRRLRKSPEFMSFAEINFYRHVSFNRFCRTHKSAVEEIAEKRECERKAISQKFMAIFERTPNELRESKQKSATVLTFRGKVV